MTMPLTTSRFEVGQYNCVFVLFSLAVAWLEGRTEEYQG